jgi:hypothetical protein
VTQSTLVSRTKRYLGLRPSPTDPDPTPPSTPFIVVFYAIFIAVGAVLIALGRVAIGSWLLAFTVVYIAQTLLHRWKPPAPRERRGWYLDPKGSGGWLWWDGSGWAERPPESTT